MTEIERIQRYVERAKLNTSGKYGLNVVAGLEMSRAAHEAKDLPLEIICLAFNYGMVKGYRAAKAEKMKEAVQHE